MRLLGNTTNDRPRSRRHRAGPPYDAVSTAADVSLLERRAVGLRERMLPALLRRLGADPEDPSARSAYAEALVELRRTESLLAAARPVLRQPRRRGQVSLGDRVTVALAGGPATAESTWVEQDLVLVHPFDSPVDGEHVWVGSALGSAVLGALPAEVIEFDTPTGRCAVRILARSAGP